MDTFTVEPSGPFELVSCDACGEKSRLATGFVRGRGGETAYAVHWTAEEVDQQGAYFDLLMAQDPESLAITLEFRITAEGPRFMVTDALGRHAWNQVPGVRRLAREDVMASPLADLAFAIVDAIWVQDARIQELHGSSA